jgi:hypothetical protein
MFQTAAAPIAVGLRGLQLGFALPYRASARLQVRKMPLEV